LAREGNPHDRNRKTQRRRQRKRDRHVITKIEFSAWNFLGELKRNNRVGRGVKGGDVIPSSQKGGPPGEEENSNYNKAGDSEEKTRCVHYLEMMRSSWVVWGRSVQHCRKKKLKKKT